MSQPFAGVARSGCTVLRLVFAAAVAGSTLGVMPAKADAFQATATLTGRVTEIGTGRPLTGARIGIDGSTRVVTLSDESGRWRLTGIVGGAHVVTVSLMGYGDLSRTVEVGATGAVTLDLALTPKPLPLEAMVVTAGRRQQRLADAPVATELVTASEIRETGASDLASVLTERTGLELQGGHPAGSGVMIQGMGSERVLILIDGQPFIGRISGTVDVSRIPTSMIERVEVVKGPQSTLYGSEAMGGVVNVITRSPGSGGAWSAATRLTAGDRGRMDVAVDAVGALGPVRGVVDAGHRDIRLAPGRTGDLGARSSRWDGLVKLSWKTPVDGLSTAFNGMVVDERQQWRSGQLGHFADNRHWSARASGTLERGAHRLSATLYGTEFEHLSRTSPGEEPVPGSGEIEVQRLVEGELLYGVASGDAALDAGLELGRESIDSDRVREGRRLERTIESFVQGTLPVGRLRLVPGVRSTWSELWGVHWTPRVAALYRPRPELGIRAAWGLGFRAPSFKELSMQFLNVGPGFGYTVRGNPDVRPETSRNLTVSVEWAGDPLWLRAQAFDNHFDDFIETRLVGDSTGIEVYSYGNIDDGWTRGVELEAGLRHGGWVVEGGWSVLRTEDRQTGESLLGRPSGSGRGSLAYSIQGGPRLSLTAIRTARTAMRRGPEGTEWREAFMRFDARASWAPMADVELTLGIDNLMDERNPEWPGFAGRHVYTGVSWRALGGS